MKGYARSVPERGVPADARAVDEAMRQIDKVFKQHQAQIERLGAQVAKLQYYEDLNRYKEALRENVRGSIAYTNVVVGLGYAGYFALWKLVETSLSPRDHALAGLWMAMSLAAFILFEVAVMIRRSWTVHDLQVALDEAGSANDTQVAVDRIIKQAERFAARIWPYALVASIGPAVVGSYYLFSALMHGLLARV